MSVARTCYYLNFYITYIIIIKNTVLLFVYKVLKNLSNNNYFVFCQKLYYLLFTPFLSPLTHYLTLLKTQLYLIILTLELSIFPLNGTVIKKS